jgi:mono/diheme cytochrome c family protein
MNPGSTRAKPNNTLTSWTIVVCIAGFALIMNACSEQHAQLISTAPDEQATLQQTELDFTEPEAVIPAAYADNCARCHGATGEGKKSGKEKGPLLTNVTTRDEDPLTADDVALIIDDAEAQGLSSKMPAFKDKLNEDQKKAIVDWIVAVAHRDHSNYPTIAAK